MTLPLACTRKSTSARLISRAHPSAIQAWGLSSLMRRAIISLSSTPARMTSFLPRTLTAPPRASATAAWSSRSSKFPSRPRAHALKLAHDAGVTTILNPAPARRVAPAILAYADIVTPNETELRILLGRAPDDPADSLDLCNELLRMGVQRVIVTRGDKGALIVTADGYHALAAFEVSVVDSTGAGDAFNGALAIALARGVPLEPAVRYAMGAGALACTRLGVIPSLKTLGVARKRVFPRRSRSRPNQRSRWSRSVKPSPWEYRKGQCSRTRATGPTPRSAPASVPWGSDAVAIIPTVMVRRVTNDGALGPRLSVKRLALSLPKKAWRTIAWREGTQQKAALAVRPRTSAHGTDQGRRSTMRGNAVDRMAQG